MNVVIVGAGEVGSSIAASLDEDHEVVVIDNDAERVENLTYSLDVLPVEGDGASLSTLQEADVEAADLLIASTDDDETNIVACATAKTVGDAFTIARVKRSDYRDTWQQFGGAFDVDFMVSSNLRAAETIVRVIGLPAARDVDVFAEGRVVMAEFRVPEGSPVAGQTVTETDRFPDLRVAAVIRDDDIVIPEGETTIEVGDELVVIGSPDDTRTFAGDLAPDRTMDDRDIVILGGSEIAVETARMLEERGHRPRLVERDPDRARELAETLDTATVMENDPTDREFLDRENVGDADVVIAALETDGKNLLASLLASRIGVGQTVSLVETAEDTRLFEEVGVNAAVNPRDVTAEEIIRFTQTGRPENVALVDHDRAEILEIEVDEDSVLAGRPIRESAADLPAGTTVGAITRDRTLVTPQGDTVVEVGDHVVAFAETDSVDTVANRI
ncbi:Trk system potassium transporter TrkA [Halococcus agarilyticus]|uniref:Trk system potassium transporter TrkA n=1 Tax=Halococcus agarilyticus TaxID=1232219 RepID=UPI0006779F16|nr:Trk system potassium transporter TrkA [Halococcus agarilyticus]